MIAGCAVAARGLQARREGDRRRDRRAIRRCASSWPASAVTVGGDTIAEGIAVARHRQGAALPSPRRPASIGVLAVDEVAIERAIALFLEVEKTVAEARAPPGLAALLAHPRAFQRGRKVGLVLSRRQRSTPRLLVLGAAARPGARRPQSSRRRLMIGDLPGQLARDRRPDRRRPAATSSKCTHQRLFGSVVAEATELDVTVESARPRPCHASWWRRCRRKASKVRSLEGADA